MTRSGSGRRALLDLIRRRWPEWDEQAAAAAIRSGEVLVDGLPATNPRSLVASGASVRLAAAPVLQGTRKLAWALDQFGVVATDRVALDVGASTGGFTCALLAAGARRVYAVEAGHGQLLGSLRQDRRVVNLERTNVGRLDRRLVPDTVSLVVVDVSYLSLSAAVSQLGYVDLARGGELLGLVKPMFELRLATIPGDHETLQRARDAAIQGVTAAGWDVAGAGECPVRGRRGAVEFFVHGRRR